MPSITSDVPVRTGSFGLEGRWLFWGRIRLYADRVEMSGWDFWGKYQREIVLDSVEEVDTRNGSLILRLHGGEHVRVLVDTPEGWAVSIRIHREVEENAE